MIDVYNAWVSEPEVVDSLVTFTGNGSSSPATTPGVSYYGKNVVSLVRTGAGAFTLTYKDRIGNLVGTGYGFQAATPSGLANYNVVFGNFDSTGTIISFVVYSGTTPTDLTSTQILSLCLTFKRAQASL